MRIIVITSIAVLFAGLASADEPAKRLPVPSAEAQAASLKTVKDAFRSDYAKKSAADAAALAKKLFDAAMETKDEPADRFVLLSESREAAVRAADATAAIGAIDQLANDFAVDSVDVRIKALQEIAKTGAAGDADNALQALIGMVEDALAADQFDRANQLLAAAKATIRRTTDKKLTARLDKLSKDIVALAKEYEALKPSVDTLKRSPDDPAANLAVGKFKCFWKGDWDNGLPMLAKGSDAKLKAIATAELKNPQQAAEQAQLGDSWWDLADVANEPIKGQLKRRAAHWYSRAIPGLSGFAKAKIERRLGEAETATTAATRLQSHNLDLFKLVDLKRDVVSGSWEVKNGSLVCKSSEPQCRFRFDYEPPAEYDFQVVFKRYDGGADVGQICAAYGRQFLWLMDGYGHRMGFDKIDDRGLDKNPTGRPMTLQNGRRYVSTVKVRKIGVQAILDGKIVGEWKTDFHDMSLTSGVNDQRALGLFTDRSPTIFFSAKVNEITGAGKRLAEK
jgi:hypothetical protein